VVGLGKFGENRFVLPYLFLPSLPMLIHIKPSHPPSHRPLPPRLPHAGQRPQPRLRQRPLPTQQPLLHPRRPQPQLPLHPRLRHQPPRNRDFDPGHLDRRRGAVCYDPGQRLVPDERERREEIGSQGQDCFKPCEHFPLFFFFFIDLTDCVLING
jgi:hypothetical protein